MHGAGAHLEVERLLQHAPLAGPELRKLEDQLLERLHENRFPRGEGGDKPLRKIERDSLSAQASAQTRERLLDHVVAAQLALEEVAPHLGAEVLHLPQHRKIRRDSRPPPAAPRGRSGAGSRASRRRSARPITPPHSKQSSVSPPRGRMAPSGGNGPPQDGAGMGGGEDARQPQHPGLEIAGGEVAVHPGEQGFEGRVEQPEEVVRRLLLLRELQQVVGEIAAEQDALRDRLAADGPAAPAPPRRGGRDRSPPSRTRSPPPWRAAGAGRRSGCASPARPGPRRASCRTRG